MFAELRELLRSGAIRRHQLGPKYLLTRKILKNERTFVFSDPHAQGNPFLLHIHADHLYFYDISNAYDLERMFDKLLVRQLRDMHQSVLMYADVYKSTEASDAPCLPDGAVHRRVFV